MDTDYNFPWDVIAETESKGQWWNVIQIDKFTAYFEIKKHKYEREMYYSIKGYFADIIKLSLHEHSYTGEKREFYYKNNVKNLQEIYNIYNTFNTCIQEKEKQGLDNIYPRSFHDILHSADTGKEAIMTIADLVTSINIDSEFHCRRNTISCTICNRLPVSSNRLLCCEKYNVCSWCLTTQENEENDSEADERELTCPLCKSIFYRSD